MTFRCWLSVAFPSDLWDHGRADRWVVWELERIFKWSNNDFLRSSLLSALAVQGLSGFPPKKQIDARKKLSKMVEKRFPEDKLLLLDTQQESGMLLRQLANQKQRHLAFRDRRAYLFAHVADFVPSEESDLVGTLKISGYVRGRTLNVNSLLHIVGHGDFQMNQIDAPVDPFPLNPRVIKSQKKPNMAMEVRLGFSFLGVEPRPSQPSTTCLHFLPAIVFNFFTEFILVCWRVVHHWCSRSGSLLPCGPTLVFKFQSR